jgi:hypothetical protein
MTQGLCIGKRYRFTLAGGASLGSLEGVVRSLSLPAGVLGNGDGEHRIWIAGEQFEWFLRPGEIAEFEELQDLALALDELQELARARSESTAAPPRRSGRAGRPYPGSCVRRGRRSRLRARPESHPLVPHLAARHRRDHI